MMKIIIFAGILLFVLAAFFFVWNFFFEIYEVNYESEFVNGNEPCLQIKIRAFPVNGMGREIKLRKVPAEYFFDDSSNIEIVKEDSAQGFINL